MAFTNQETKEIHCKVLVLGPKGAGKSETLRSIYSQTSSEVKSGLLEVVADEKKNHFFEFLPLSIGYVQDYHIKLHLYTLPMKTLFETTHQLMLKGVDGIVYVCDSRYEAIADNIEEYDKVKKTLSKANYHLPDMPRVFQYNKRDSKDAVDVSILRNEINGHNYPEFETVATESVGTLNVVEGIAKQILSTLAAEA